MKKKSLKRREHNLATRTETDGSCLLHDACGRAISDQRVPSKDSEASAAIDMAIQSTGVMLQAALQAMEHLRRARAALDQPSE